MVLAKRIKTKKKIDKINQIKKKMTNNDIAVAPAKHIGRLCRRLCVYPEHTAALNTCFSYLELGPTRAQDNCLSLLDDEVII